MTQTELQFADHKIAPAESGSDNQVILWWLMRGGTLTSEGAKNYIGTTRLAARIFDLKQDGYNILDRTIEVEKRSGKTARVKQYRLSPLDFRGPPTTEAV